MSFLCAGIYCIVKSYLEIGIFAGKVSALPQFVGNSVTITPRFYLVLFLRFGVKDRTVLATLGLRLMR